MSLRLLAEAEEDVRVSADWYERRQPGLGIGFVEAVTHAIQSVEASPLRFVQVGASRPGSEIRSYGLTKYPFSIIYEIVGEDVLVLAVAHHSRRPDYWLRRKP